MKKNIKEKIEKSYNPEIKKILKILTDAADSNGMKIFLVGGMVRDLLLGRPSIDLDITVDNNSGIEFARIIAGILDGELKVYPKFRTATLYINKSLDLDIATCRREEYVKPGVLPEVQQSGIKDDLYRRDFSINAIAVSLNRNSFGEILDYYNGRNDLKNKLIRVLNSHSFIDDPTRIFRAIRFSARLGFDIESKTKTLMEEAIRKDVFDTVSKSRLREEIKLILKEKNVLAQFKGIDKNIGFKVIHPDIKFKDSWDKVLNNVGEYFSMKKSISLSCDKQWIINLMILLDDIKMDDVNSICDDFNFSNDIKNKVKGYKKIQKQESNIINNLKKDIPSQVYKTLNVFPLEALLVFFAKVEEESVKNNVLKFISKYRFVDTCINGEDLKQMGLTPGPRFNRILSKILYAKLDGKVKNRKDELDFVKKLI